MSQTIEKATDITKVKHAWYSPTQELVLKQSQRERQDGSCGKGRGVPIYRDVTGSPIRVTMVGDTIEHNTSFKDMEYLGEVSQFIGLGEFREDLY